MNAPAVSVPSTTDLVVAPFEGRSLHLVDIENLIGSGLPNVTDINLAVDLYERLIPTGATDLRIVGIGSGPAQRFAVTAAWPGGRVRSRPGPDGAERAILDAVGDEPDLAARFERLVIASGDHAFVALARDCRLRGIEVVVVSRPGSLSRHLEAVTHSVIVFAEPVEADPAATEAA